MTPALLAARAEKSASTAEAVEAADYARDNPRTNAIGRMVDAAEIADLALYLCSDRAWCVTGETIAADGGGGTAVYY